MIFPNAFAEHKRLKLGQNYGKQHMTQFQIECRTGGQSKAANTKNTLYKGDLGQNKNITPKIYGILKASYFWIFWILTFKGSFWFWQFLVYFVTD